MILSLRCQAICHSLGCYNSIFGVTIIVRLDALKGFKSAYIDICEDAFEDYVLFSGYFSNDLF